jgi:hypothetical protein
MWTGGDGAFPFAHHYISDADMMFGRYPGKTAAALAELDDGGSLASFAAGWHQQLERRIGESQKHQAAGYREHYFHHPSPARRLPPQ